MADIQASVFIATSLDGFIARKNGSIDWLESMNALVPPGEDCGYKKFMDSVDAIVMGRKTYETGLSFPQWPYIDKQVIVLSSQSLEIRNDLPKTVTSSSENPKALLNRLGKIGAKRVYIDGGQTIRGFLVAGLIQDMTITLIPTVLGEGRPLFGPMERDLNLKLVGSRVYPFGYVQLTYGIECS